MFGLLNVNKPAGYTSRDIVTRVARQVGRKVKVGHAGTLDPLATGVLVLCVGPATRLVPLIHEHLKSYEAVFQLGTRSQTDDTEGTLEAVPIPDSLNSTQIQAALPEFTGKIQQVPPAFSAVKVNGKRAYKVARQGAEVTLAAREVSVTCLDLISYEKPNLSLSIDCGTGTYIRSIGRDLARRLGTEAVMTQLVRTRVGAFTLETACDAEELTRQRLPELIISPLAMLGHLPQVVVNEDQALRLNCGQAIEPPELTPSLAAGEQVAIVNQQGTLIAIAGEKRGSLAPQIVLRDNS